MDTNPSAFELPPEIANPQQSPCVNVPEWFVKEGGELCLSDTEKGVSILRYWPKFLSDKGNHLMFKRLRNYCKWHQKQVNRILTDQSINRLRGKKAKAWFVSRKATCQLAI